MLKKLAIWCGLAVVLITPAWAGNGHMVHGAGPVNSSMGGAGAGLLNGAVGALMFNPALIAGVEGNQISFGTEFFKDGIQIDVTLNNGDTGRTIPTNQLGVLPSFGWMGRAPDSKLAMGFGLIAIAGFRTDYPEDPESIVFNTPPDGFGRIFTDYRVIKIPAALAYQVNPKLALGGSLNLYLAELAIAPLPHKVFDTVDASGPRRFYPQGGNLVNKWSVSAQLGFVYDYSDQLTIGGSFTTPQNYDPFTWNSTFADPSAANFGQHRPLDFDLDGPGMATVGVGIRPNDQLSIAVDTMYVKYKGVSGFGSPGGIVDRIVFPFGWRNVWVFKSGVEWEASPMFALRAGYNHSQTPIRDEVVLTATGAPATFQKHFTFGVGTQINPFLRANASVYFVPREHSVGPFPDLDNNVLGTMDTSNKLTGVLIGLNWAF